MDWFQDLALKAVLSSVVRHGLSLLGGVLTERGWVNGDDWSELAIKAAPALVALGLSLAAQSRNKKKLDVALDLPAGSSPANLKQAMKVAAVALCVLGLSVPAFAQNTVRLKTAGKQGTISTNGGSVELDDTGGLASLLVQTLDSYSGTWEVQCSADGGVTYDADDEVVLVLMGDTTGAGVVSVTDVVGIWQGNISGCNAIKVIATAGFAASDTAVRITAITPGGGSGGGGGGSGDTELPAVETPGDDLTNATQAPRVISLMHCFDGTTWDRCQTTRDPCDGAAKTVIPINIATATTTELTASLAGASTHYYVCSINLGPTAGAQNFALVDDDTDNCASVTSGLAGGTTAGTGWNFAANGGLVMGNGQGTVLKTNGTNRVLCAVTSAAVQISGVITVVAAP